MKENPKAEVERYLSKLDPPIRKLVMELRNVVLEAVPDLNEVIKWRSLVYERKGKICSIMVHRSHVNLQIWRGAELADLERLLEGSGKGMRHVKVRNFGDIKVDAFKRLIREATELDKS